MHAICCYYRETTKFALITYVPCHRRKASTEHFFLSPVPLRTAHTEKLHPLRHRLHYRETIPEKSKRYNRGNGRQK